MRWAARSTVFADLPIEVEIASWLSALGAGAVSFIASRKRGRNPWRWAIAAFLLVIPAIIVLQLRVHSASRKAIRWWPHFVLASLLVAASVALDQAPLSSQSVAAFEARALDSWFSHQTLLAEGTVLHAAEGMLGLSGNFSRPLVLGLVGAALGVLMVRRTRLSTIALGSAGAILGAAAWFAVITTATARWLDHQSEATQLPTWPTFVGFGALLWLAIAWAWLSERPQRAAQQSR
jgi:hypothetical protein